LALSRASKKICVPGPGPPLIGMIGSKAPLT